MATSKKQAPTKIPAPDVLVHRFYQEVSKLGRPEPDGIMGIKIAMTENEIKGSDDDIGFPASPDKVSDPPMPETQVSEQRVPTKTLAPDVVCWPCLC
ncbi:hypothetical protein TSUD_175160 [Trifolium subterraneum]|uniref:Uncharacterized protein n=1 Tax=Trifolium subterraneum TaxID=3900 RepID=A0A2Z6LW90_TRISU|nr:hypothetical protein TSUD_175160 [Trifolium subterraneum]